MFNMINTLRVTVIALSLCFGAGLAHAEGEQFYFIGQVAPAGGLDAPGRLAGYLRWDIVEGALPPSVVGFELQRDGDVLHTTRLDAPMDARAIGALYAGELHRQRRAALIATLDGAREEGAQAIDANTFAQALARRLLDASRGDQGALMWVRLASRVDPLIAVAAGFAYLDERLEEQGEYTLFALDAEGQRAPMGTVNLVARPTRIEAPADLRQVLDLSRCDAPEAGKLHGVVALDWDNPGAHQAARYSSALHIAGYDIYRSVSAEHPGELDLASLAGEAELDDQGHLRFRGLEQVNSGPVMISGRPEPDRDGRRTEADRKGWNAGFAQHMQPKAVLQAAGLNPGDRRRYYVVSRDITGHYGATTSVDVVVPDVLAPPAPWGVVAQPISVVGGPADAEEMELVWTAVDVDGYQKEHIVGGRQWCNLATAQAERRLRFASSGALCGTPAERTLNLDVSEYVIYLFSTAEKGVGFTDTDGDGYSDLIERVPGAEAGLTLPGTACDPNRGPREGQSHQLARIPADAFETNAQGRRLFRFRDRTPARTKGKVYWYRVAAVGRNGRVSAVSAPVRALFPDVEKPRRVPAEQVQFGGCNLRTSFLEGRPDFAQDTTGLATSVKVACQVLSAPGGVGNNLAMNGSQFTQPGVSLSTPFSLRTLVEAELVLEDGVATYAADENFCAKAAANACDARTLLFLDASGQIISAAPLPNGDPCEAGASLELDCSDGPARPMAPGEMVFGPVMLDLPTVTDCVDIFIDTESGRQRLETFCPQKDGQWPWQWTPPSMGADLICLSFSIVNANNQNSTVQQLPCFKAASNGPPEPPRVTTVGFAGDTATVRWFAPEGPTAGVIVEWYNRAAPLKRSAEFFPHNGRYGAQSRHSGQLALPPLGDAVQTWCVRARSAAQARTVEGQNVSEWSPPVCRERRPQGVPLPEYLPWPTMPSPPATPNALKARLLEHDDHMAILLNRNASVWRIGAETCIPQVEAPLPECDAASCMTDAPLAFDCDICPRVKAIMGDVRNFVVYRQSKAGADAEPGPFAQVSPLIEGAHCGRSCDRPLININPRQGCFSVRQCEGVGQICAPVLADPWIKPLRYGADDPEEWPRVGLGFVDRSPYIRGRHYRYQLVFFDAQGEISRHSTTNWVVTSDLIGVP